MVLGACAIAVLGSGCTAGSGGNAAPHARAGTTLTAEQRAALAAAQRASRDPRQAAELARYRQGYDRYVTDCMRRAGFRYVPPPPEPARSPGTPPWDPNRYGFGISTLIDAQARLAPAPGAPPKLSPAERAAHNHAAAQCMQAAQHALGLPPGTVVVDADLSAITDEARRQAAADPRVVRLIRIWSACMQAAGVPAASRSDLLAEIDRRAAPFRDAYRAAVAARPDPAPLLTDILDAAQRQRLAALQRFELRAAAADRRCDHGLKDLTFTVFQEKLNALTSSAGG